MSYWPVYEVDFSVVPGNGQVAATLIGLGKNALDEIEATARRHGATHVYVQARVHHRTPWGIDESPGEKLWRYEGPALAPSREEDRS
jgi:hypothetical protein